MFVKRSTPKIIFLKSLSKRLKPSSIKFSAVFQNYEVLQIYENQVEFKYCKYMSRDEVHK